MISNLTKSRFFCAVLSTILMVGLCVPVLEGPRDAWGDRLSEAKAAVDAAEAEVERLSSEYDELQQQAIELDDQIEKAAREAEKAQRAVAHGQSALGETIAAAYKSESSTSLAAVLLTSENLRDFLRNLTYYSSVQQSQAQSIEDQKELQRKYREKIEKLDAKKDAQDDLLNQAAEKKAEAEAAVKQASANVTSIEAEEQKRLEELQKRAAALREESKPAEQKPISNKWNTNTSHSTSNDSDDDTPASANQSNESKEESSPSNTEGNAYPSNPSTKGWKTGLASAYGGSSDSSTPNPGTTATGAVCNDSSMGVAIPMAWSNYRSYFGKRIEIRYGGKTVLATVNDCGGLAGGARSLDLQPGVFKKFGFSTCRAWGVRTVEYRFL